MAQFASICQTEMRASGEWAGDPFLSESVVADRPACYAFRMSDPKPQFPECDEGPEAARRFQDFARRLVAVPREEYEKRHKAWEKTRKKQRKKI